MESYPRITYLQALPNYRLFLIFDNGEIKIYSLSERLQTPTFAPLKDEALFDMARLANGGYGVIWNEELDLSEYELWVKGVEVSKISELNWWLKWLSPFSNFTSTTIKFGAKGCKKLD